MTKKKYVTTSTDTNKRYKQRNKQAAAASRKKKEDILKALQKQNAVFKARNSILQTNIALFKEKIIYTDALLKENQQLKKQLCGIRKQQHTMKSRIKQLSIMILEMY